MKSAFGDQLKATETVALRSATVSVTQKISSEAADSQRSEFTGKPDTSSEERGWKRSSTWLVR
ncbi:hypothetical protein [Rubritalea profundi]|uniref:Uncharacterized protein n=1 Tax=Rubritalea profundi TaxID=1658618 RepID=A0A2S7U0D4_9BACT|nr:hypothetical protein [Rubritalea profundi]PQJ27782.1 hypothetical protein BSZ32_04200 [Rubritalea profundi]